VIGDGKLLGPTGGGQQEYTEGSHHEGELITDAMPDSGQQCFQPDRETPAISADPSLDYAH
jgi:hypothetical protein